MTTNSTRPWSAAPDEELGANVHGKRRPVALGTGEPARVLRATYSAKSLRSERCRLRRASERRARWRRQTDLPARQLRDQLDPLPQARSAPRPRARGTGDEIPRQALLADAVALEQARDHREDLAAGPASRGSRPPRSRSPPAACPLPRLGDHHDGMAGSSARISPISSSRAARAFARPAARCCTAGAAAARARRRRGRRGHREPLALEEAPVRRGLDFVIYPEDGLRRTIGQS